ncbi:MAG: hypothetical protein K0Q67_3077 [Cellvibrio sp.]|nr:hypothetical protein [Cellvibrio sp.]
MDTTLHRLLASSSINALMNSIVGHYVTIYMIHRPQPLDGAYEGLTPALLEECIVYAKNAGFEFASIDEILADAIAGRKPQRPTICFTLDDGYQDQLDQLVPVLLAHQCKPTLFTIVDMIDGIVWPWDARLSYATWTSTQTNANFQFNNVRFDLLLDQPAARIRSRRRTNLSRRHWPHWRSTPTPVWLPVIVQPPGTVCAAPNSRACVLVPTRAATRSLRCCRMRKLLPNWNAPIIGSRRNSKRPHGFFVIPPVRSMIIFHTISHW